MTRSAETRLRKLEQARSSLPRRVHSVITDEFGTAEERLPFDEKRAALIASGVAAEHDFFIESVIVDPAWPGLTLRDRDRGSRLA